MSQVSPPSTIDELEALPDKESVAALAGAQIDAAQRGSVTSVRDFCRRWRSLATVSS
jgi:hypothetical protein